MNILPLILSFSRSRSYKSAPPSFSIKSNKILPKNTAKAVLSSDVVNSLESKIASSSSSGFDDFRSQASINEFRLFNRKSKKLSRTMRALGNKYSLKYGFLSDNLNTSFKIDLAQNCNKWVSKRTALGEALVSWDQPDHLISWNQLCLDTATKSSSGPTPFARFFKYVNDTQFDSWALFDPVAIGSIYRVENEKKLTKLLKNVGISSSNLKDFRKTYKYSSGLEKRALEAGLRGAVADIAAFEVFSEISTSLFKNGEIPQDLLDRAENLLEENLEDLLVLGTKRAELIRNVAVEIADQISSSINAYALEDRSNQSNFYADTTGYQVSPSVFDPSQENPTLDSYWQPISDQPFLTPHWGEVKTFATKTDDLISKDIIRPYLDSGDLNPSFIDQLNDIVDIALNLTADQRLTAEFWEGGEGTSAPPGLLIQITDDLIKEHKLNLRDATIASYKVSNGLHDGAIVAWANKTFFNSVRPVTSINQYYYDQNLPDGSLGQYFDTYLSSPPFGEYTSGHSTFSAAAFGILTDVFNSNIFDLEQTFQDGDSLYSQNGFDGLEGISEEITLAIKYFSGGTESAGASRRYGAIHFDEADLIGRVTGTQVAEFVSAKTKNLLRGIDSEAEVPFHLPSLVFGTLGDDTLTGLPQSEPNQTQKMYAYAGQDTLIADEGLICHLYGGIGSDTFKLSSSQVPLIRDYSSEDSISLSESYFSSGGSISQLEFSYSSSGLFTDVSINNRKLFCLDGIWSLDELSISTFV